MSTPCRRSWALILARSAWARAGRARPVDRLGVAPAGREPFHRRVGDRADQQRVPGGQQPEPGQQAGRQRGRVQVGEQHDQAALPRGGQHGAGHRPEVGLGQLGVQHRHRAGEGGEHVAPARPDHPGADPAVHGQQVDPVAGPRGQRRQQQRRVHRGVQPRHASHPARRGASGVQQHDDPPVPLWPPGGDHDLGPPGRGPPVDGPDVVAGHVLAQRVELGPLPPDQRPVHAVKLTQPGQLLREVPPAEERRQHPDRPGRATAALPAGQPERSKRADCHRAGLPVAAPGRPQRRGQRDLAAARQRDPEPARRGAGARRPGVPDGAAQRAPPVAGDGHGDLGVVAEQDPGIAGPGHLQPAGRRGEQDVGDDRDREQPVGQHNGGDVAEHQHDQRADQRGQCRAAGQRHRGTGTEASTPSSTPSVLTPSSSASGRSCIRCRNVGVASAFTSSGVT